MQSHSRCFLSQLLQKLWLINSALQLSYTNCVLRTGEAHCSRCLFCYFMVRLWPNSLTCVADLTEAEHQRGRRRLA